ncbi:RNA methyltransferase [Caulobacter segnis]|uniref:tRNA/rRNA methyltransferase (SpoU) n=2 Tax=Caulobacter segnis TaxID=88688 RepID=D5VKX0_CAUST|nr:RNA methyltransferase [Caulobacter segnis]ADG11143.1 tRNA/rRNA methyltransferase (SpoU) [Caulobacter segnis ATCC 21756]AVQ02827.1 RNA methyltransferase [Caulobacter segnis]
MSTKTVTSLTNATVKAVRALHMRKEREESGLFLAEGLKIVIEAIDCGHAPKIVMYGPDAADHPMLKKAVAACLKAGGEVIEVNREILEKVSRRDNPQAVVAVFRQVFTPLTAIVPESAPCWVAMQAVRDPGNLGTVIRTADAAGCGGVILVGDCVDPYSVEGVRATMGSIFAVKIAKATIPEFLAWRETWPGSVVGTLLTATVDHKSADYVKPSLILMGNEQQGLPPELAAACDVNVKIPMRGRADSLNLSVATGIMIYTVTG